MNPQISILILGNQHSNLGFRPLVAINADTLSKKYAEYDNYDSFFINSEYYVKVEHSTDALIYSLTFNTNAVKEFGGQRAGRLCILVSVPPCKKFGDGKKMSQLLFAVKDLFIANCMQVVTLEFMQNKRFLIFKDGTYDVQPFVDLLSSYKLVDYDRYIPMTGSISGYFATGTEERMYDLIDDTQFKEFSNLKDLRFAPRCENHSLLSLVIPRPVSYKLLINGVEAGTISALRPFSAVINPPDRYSTPRQIDNLRLEDVIGDRVPGGRLEGLSDAKETIYLRLGFEKMVFTRKLKLRLNFCEQRRIEVTELLKACTLRSKSGLTKQMTFVGDGFELSLIGREIEEQFDVVGIEGFSVTMSYARDRQVDEGFIDVTPMLVGLRIMNVPEAFMDARTMISLKLMINQSNYSIQKGPQPNTLIVPVPPMRTDEVKKISLSAYGYSFDEIRSTTVAPDRYLNIMFPGYRVIAPVTPPAASAGAGVAAKAEVFKLRIKGIYTDATAIVELPSVSGAVSSSIAIALTGFKDAVVVELPANVNKLPLNVSFKKKGYEVELVENVKCVNGFYEFQMPPLEKFSAGKRFARFLKRSKLLLIILFLLLGLAGGAAAMYFGKTMLDDLIAGLGTKKEVVIDRPTVSTTAVVDTTDKDAKIKDYMKRLNKSKLSFIEVEEMSSFVDAVGDYQSQDFKKFRRLLKIYDDTRQIAVKVKTGQYTDATELNNEVDQLEKEINANLDAKKLKKTAAKMHLAATDSLSLVARQAEYQEVEYFSDIK